MGDPLSTVELVHLVVFDTVSEESVDQLADSGHGTALIQVAQLIELVGLLKRVDKDINEQVDDLDLSQELLVL